MNKRRKMINERLNLKYVLTEFIKSIDSCGCDLSDFHLRERLFDILHLYKDHKKRWNKFEIENMHKKAREYTKQFNLEYSNKSFNESMEVSKEKSDKL